ncbi:MAG: sarcosine oxidase subunit gamma family protein [Pseudomonadota bacterium]
MIEATLIEPRSPLAHRAPIGAEDTVRLAEIRLATLSILRGEADGLVGPVRDAFALDLPREACTAAQGDAAACLWLGPDEWMLVSGTGEGDRHAALDDGITGHHQRVEVSDHYTLIELRGAKARPLLSKLVPLDMHARAFAPGEVKGTALGAAVTTLWCVADDVFRLTARRSYADYVWCLLAHSGREWGLPVQSPRGGERLTLPAA